MAWVYGIQSGQFIKVGVANDIQARLKMFRLYNPHPIKVVLRRMVPEDYWVEKRMHQLLAAYAIGREWFDVAPDLVRTAYEQAYKDLVTERWAQANWERFSARRSEARDAPVGRPRKMGTGRGMDNSK